MTPPQEIIGVRQHAVLTFPRAPLSLGNKYSDVRRRARTIDIEDLANDNGLDLNVQTNDNRKKLFKMAITAVFKVIHGCDALEKAWRDVATGLAANTAIISSAHRKMESILTQPEKICRTGVCVTNFAKQLNDQFTRAFKEKNNTLFGVLQAKTIGEIRKMVKNAGKETSLDARTKDALNDFLERIPSDALDDFTIPALIADTHIIDQQLKLAFARQFVPDLKEESLKNAGKKVVLITEPPDAPMYFVAQNGKVFVKDLSEKIDFDKE